MGWTSYHNPPRDGAKAECDRLCTWENENGTRRVLDSAIVRLTTYYAAVEHISPDGTRRVWAAVFLLNLGRGNFSYKDMDESVGPTERNCPERILKLLTPLADDDKSYAVQWRADCWANVEARKAKRGMARRLTDGQKVEVSYRLGNTDYTEATVVMTTRNRRPTPLFRTPNGALFNLRGWKERLSA